MNTWVIIMLVLVALNVGFVAGARWCARRKQKAIYAFDFHKDMVRVTITGRELDIKCGECS